MREAAARALDTVLDRTVVLGYSKIGYGIRRRASMWPASPPPGSLRDRDVVVAGASSGLGIATAESLARLGARVHLVVRNTVKGEQVRADLRRLVPGAELELWRCDLADLDDVRRFAAELALACPAVAGLVHNAGVMPPQRSVSPQGHELSLATHVLGPVALTEGLLEPLAAARGRVVFVTSGGMYARKLAADDPEYDASAYKPATAYARSKRVQVALLPALERRWSGRGVSVYATHPGWADTPGVVESLPGFHRLTRPILRDAASGADTSVWLVATQPAPASGELWHDRRVRPTHLLPWTRESAEDRDLVWSYVREAAGLPE